MIQLVEVGATGTQPYVPADFAEFAAWQPHDIEALPFLPEAPAGWDLLQLEPVPQRHQLAALARAARAVFAHLRADQGARLGLALVKDDLSSDTLVALYREVA